MSSEDVVVPDEWIRLAHRLADAAREQTVPRFRTALTVDDKAAGAFDPVTIADREAERVMREILAEEVPDHGVLGEEHGERVSDSPWRWVLDPIDGTRAYIAGFPTWVTLVGLCHQGRPVYGIIDAPASDDRWAGGSARPAGAVRACPDLSQAILSTTSPELFRRGADRAAWQALSARSRMRRYGGDGYAYGLVANGLVDAVVESGLKAVDVTAVIPVVRAAGGIVTGWDGGDALRGHLVAAGDRRVHAQILEILAACGATAQTVARAGG